MNVILIVLLIFLWCVHVSHLFCDDCFWNIKADNFLALTKIWLLVMYCGLDCYLSRLSPPSLFSFNLFDEVWSRFPLFVLDYNWCCIWNCRMASWFSLAVYVCVYVCNMSIIDYICFSLWLMNITIYDIMCVFSVYLFFIYLPLAYVDDIFFIFFKSILVDKTCRSFRVFIYVYP